MAAGRRPDARVGLGPAPVRLALAGVLIALRRPAGHRLGLPAAVAAGGGRPGMLILAVALNLSASSAWTSLRGVGSGSPEAAGQRSSLARWRSSSPRPAPFMGPALGWADTSRRWRWWSSRRWAGFCSPSCGHFAPACSPAAGSRAWMDAFRRRWPSRCSAAAWLVWVLTCRRDRRARGSSGGIVVASPLAGSAAQRPWRRPVAHHRRAAVLVAGAFSPPRAGLCRGGATGRGRCATALQPRPPRRLAPRAGPCWSTTRPPGA